jgi:hypothetical protein
MAKQIIKARAKALETEAAKIGDNSIGAEGKKYLADIAKLGKEAGEFEKQSGKKMLEAVLLFAKAVKEGKLTENHAQQAADGYKGTKAPKQLVSDFKSFADKNVLAAADYSLTPSAVPGKSHFQACMAINQAIKRAVKLDKKLPTVNAAFAKAALAYKRDKPEPVNPRTKGGRAKLAEAALKRIREIVKDLVGPALKGAAESKADLKLTDAQVKALDTLASVFA